MSTQDARVTSPPRHGLAARLCWAELPAEIRGGIEDELGDRVVDEIVQSGGFSPGLASRVLLADGRRAFIKAISAQRNATAPHLYRREAAVMATLPPAAPAPGLRAVYDDGQWVALVLDDIDGRSPGQPWTPEDLDQVLDALEQMAAALTPALSAVPTIVDDLADNFSSWETLARQARAGEPLPAGLDPWALTHLSELADLEAGWAVAAAGDTLLHADLRGDNILITDRQVHVVDWPYAVRGAAWVDLMMFLASSATDPVVDPERVWRSRALTRDVDPAAANAVLAAIAGDFTVCSLQPAPPNLTDLREHQSAKAAAALTWLRRRLHDPVPGSTAKD